MALTLVARIKKNSIKSANGCWDWQGYTTASGYGVSEYGSRSKNTRVRTTAHRISYIAYKGEIPDGYQIDHLCRNRACVNPEHLEAVTPSVNVRRSDAHYKKQQARTHCPQGHEYNEENTYKRPTVWGGISRSCYTCMLERSAQRYARKQKTASIGVA